MRKIKLSLIPTLFFCLSAMADNLSQEINQILQKTTRGKNSNLNIGIVIETVPNGQILYQSNANRLYAPASIQKLFTAAAGLSYLKPDFHFYTRLLSNGELKNGELNGNLTVQFTGDPFLNVGHLNELFDQLARSGVKSINGNIYIDNFAFDNVPYPPGWLWDDLSYAFAAPTGAIILNHNEYLLHFVPTQINQPPRLEASLPSGVINYKNFMLTSNTYTKGCPILIYSNDQNLYTVYGCLIKRWGEQSRALAIRDPVSYTKAVVVSLLHKHDIHFSGFIQTRRASNDEHVIAQHVSPPLSKIVLELLKKSDNLTTNAVFKALGAVYFHTQGTWQNGISAVKQVLGPQTGIDFKTSKLNDASGLSRYNLITPMQFAKLLNFIYKDPTVHEPLINALPIAGKDGTLRGRMPTMARGEKVHAKTGTMTSVSSLAGYVKTAHHGTVGFVIIVNGFVGKYRPYRALEDRICEYLARY